MPGGALRLAQSLCPLPGHLWQQSPAEAAHPGGGILAIPFGGFMGHILWAGGLPLDPEGCFTKQSMAFRADSLSACGKGKPQKDNDLGFDLTPSGLPGGQSH